MGRRRHVPPDAHRIAERFGVEPASEEAGKRAYLIASALGTANDLRDWEPSSGIEEYVGSSWQTFTAGLSERDKLCWRLIAAAALAA